MRLGDRKYACDLQCVQEIVTSPMLEPGLDGPSHQVGVFEGSRGPLPVLDLLGRPPDECPIQEMTLVVIDSAGKSFGLLADEILIAVDIDPEQVLPLPPRTDGISDNFISGVAPVSGSSYYLIKPEMVVSQFSTGQPACPADRRRPSE
jgi:chemotaxis signal transduction protein